MEPLTSVESSVGVGVDDIVSGDEAVARTDFDSDFDSSRRSADGDTAASGDDAGDRRPGSTLGDETADPDSLDESTAIGVSCDAIPIDRYSQLAALIANKLRLSCGQNGDGRPNDNSFPPRCTLTRLRNLAGRRRVRCGLIACSGRGLLATSTLTSVRCAHVVAMSSARPARELESEPLLVDLPVALVLAGLAPDISATVVSVSVMLSFIPTGGTAVASTAVARSVGVDTARVAGLAVALVPTDCGRSVGRLGIIASSV